ncbi:MAG TPA: Tim44/TimA family putative adaptor protein, partial [Azospirillaceae bacterium]|nr:Tim44/TimA family putative adaptor protein [Azospirillaceae bacterium]
RDDRAAAPAPDEPLSLAARINQVREADGGFEEKSFLAGARAAFEMIVQAFAIGDLASLRPLLSDEVFANFSRAVKDRQAAGETLETRIAAIRDIDLADARLEGSVAFITIRFVSDQTNVTKDADGRIVDGDPNEPIEVIDLWTFARNVRSRDPNWTLVETRAPN